MSSYVENFDENGVQIGWTYSVTEGLITSTTIFDNDLEITGQRTEQRDDNGELVFSNEFNVIQLYLDPDLRRKLAVTSPASADVAAATVVYVKVK